MRDWIRLESDTKLHHVVALVALSLLILARWWFYLTSAAALGDEGIYLQAFRAVADGRGLREVSGFYYPATFASFGGWLMETLGDAGTRALLRTSSVVGLAVTVWLSACLWRARWSRRLAASMVYVSISPAVYYGIETGNIAFAISGAILLALSIWALKPLVSGVLLGTSTAIKPLAPLAILALSAHRPVPDSRRQWFSGAVGGALALAFLSLNPGYLATQSGVVDRLPYLRSISLNRILVLLGLELNPLAIAAILGVLIVWVALRWPMSRQEILCFGGLAAVLAVPIIWSHTLLLTLPLQVLALYRATVRRRQVRQVNRLWWRYELIFVVLAVAALQLTGGAGSVDDQAVPFQLVVLTGAYLAAPILMAYVLATSRKTEEL